MKYNLTLLAEEYSLTLLNLNTVTKKPSAPTFNINSYNDYEYNLCIKEINNYLNNFNEIDAYEQFLKGE